MIKRRDWILLLIFIVIGLFLRINFVKDGAITFGFDQARDAYNAQAIFKGDLKIQGPSASTPGLFHGVLYDYLISPAYFLGQGDPLAANIWLSLINILTIIPIFIFGKKFFNSYVGFIASFLFAVSFDAVQYANWMSNPAPAVFGSAIFYLGLAYYLFTPKRMLGVILTAVGLGISTQFEIFLGYLVAPLMISIFVYKRWPNVKEFLVFTFVSLIATATMIISYIKFGFTFLNGVSSLSASADPFGAWREFSPVFLLYLNRFAEYFYRGLLPFNVSIAAILGVIMVVSFIYWAKNDKRQKPQMIFLLLMLFCHGLLIPFGGQSTPFINAGLQIIVLTIVSLFIFKLFQTNKIPAIALLLLIVFASLNAIYKYNPDGQTVFAIQRGLTLKNELAAIDYTYKSSNGENFTVNTITSPLWINTVWSYLYNWYGQKTYGFVPSFHGRDQTGYLGQMPEVNKQEKVIYLIQEPLAGIPVKFAQDTVAYEDSFSKVVEEKDFEGIIVQKRILTKPIDQINFVK